MTGKNEKYHPEDTFDSHSALLTWLRPPVKHLMVSIPLARMEGLTGGKPVLPVLC